MTRPNTLNFAIQQTRCIPDRDLKLALQSLDPLVLALIDERVDTLAGHLPDNLAPSKKREIVSAALRALLLIANIYAASDATVQEESDEDYQAYLNALHEAQPPFTITS